MVYLLINYKESDNITPYSYLIYNNLIFIEYLYKTESHFYHSSIYIYNGNPKDYDSTNDYDLINDCL